MGAHQPEGPGSDAEIHQKVHQEAECRRKNKPEGILRDKPDAEAPEKNQIDRHQLQAKSQRTGAQLGGQGIKPVRDRAQQKSEQLAGMDHVLHVPVRLIVDEIADQRRYTVIGHDLAEGHAVDRIPCAEHRSPDKKLNQKINRSRENGYGHL
ncbi:hypothetical protein D3C76_1185650 [compost metagenome]